MPHDDPLNWQPISEMPLIASMVDRAIDDTRDHIKALTEARARPHVLNDATIDRVEQVHTEQLAFPDIYAQQIGRWRTETPSTAQTRELATAQTRGLDRMEEQNRQLRAVTEDVLALALVLLKGTIDRIMAMSDVEIGLQALLGSRPASRR